MAVSQNTLPRDVHLIHVSCCKLTQDEQYNGRQLPYMHLSCVGEVEPAYQNSGLTADHRYASNLGQKTVWVSRTILIVLEPSTGSHQSRFPMLHVAWYSYQWNGCAILPPFSVTHPHQGPSRANPALVGMLGTGASRMAHRYISNTFFPTPLRPLGTGTMV